MHKEKGTKIISLLRIFVIAVIFAKINYNGNINEFGMWNYDQKPAGAREKDNNFKVLSR